MARGTRRGDTRSPRLQHRPRSVDRCVHKRYRTTLLPGWRSQPIDHKTCHRPPAPTPTKTRQAHYRTTELLRMAKPADSRLTAAAGRYSRMAEPANSRLTAVAERYSPDGGASRLTSQPATAFPPSTRQALYRTTPDGEASRLPTNRGRRTLLPDGGASQLPTNSGRRTLLPGWRSQPTNLTTCHGQPAPDEDYNPPGPLPYHRTTPDGGASRLPTKSGRRTLLPGWRSQPTNLTTCHGQPAPNADHNPPRPLPYYRTTPDGEASQLPNYPGWRSQPTTHSPHPAPPAGCR